MGRFRPAVTPLLRAALATGDCQRLKDPRKRAPRPGPGFKGQTTMASALFGVDYKVRWPDYQSVATPPAGVPADMMMETRTKTTVLGLDVVARGPASGPPFAIPDTLAVKVSITPDSWRLSSLSAAPGRKQVWLI